MIDFVLAVGGEFLTHNYYLSPTYVARRRGLLRPAHHGDETYPKFDDQSGLTPRHQEALAAMREQLTHER